MVQLNNPMVVMVERDAMGADEYHPISRKGTNLSEAGGIGYMVVDALDTMLIMGLDAEYRRAHSWVEEKMSFERDANFNTFEVRPLFRPCTSDSFRRRRFACSADCFLRITSPEVIHFT